MKQSVLDFVPKAAQLIYGNLPCPYQTLELCEKVKDLEGDFCECGVAAGGTSAVMAKFILAENLNKKIHLLDSFQGIPYPTEFDGGFIDGKVVPRTGELISTGISSCSVENVKINMRGFGIPDDIFLYHAGWLEETLPVVSNEIQSLSFLRIDVDLYRPTLYSLQYLYPKLVKGGYILIHDDCKELAGPRKAVANFIKTVKSSVEKVYHFSEFGGMYWRKK